MDKTTLVSLDIAEGAEVIAALEHNGIPISVALWMVTPEYEEGRLAIASSVLPQENPLKDAEKLVRSLRESFQKPIPPLLILRMDDPLVLKLREVFGGTTSVEGMRLGGQRIGNRYLEDAYVYKIS